MKLRKLLESILADSDAGDEADDLGLHHKGWGRYYDDDDTLVAKSVNGQLVRVTPEDPENTDPDYKDAFGRLSTDPDAPSKMSRATAAFSSSHHRDDPAQVAQLEKMRKITDLLTQMKDNGAEFDDLDPKVQQQLKQLVQKEKPLFNIPSNPNSVEFPPDADEFEWPHSYDDGDAMQEPDEPMPSLSSMIPDDEPDKWNDPEYIRQSRDADEFDRNPRLYGPDEVAEDSKPAKGKKWKTNGVSHGQKGARIAPGTKKGDAYCARSNNIKGDWRSDPNSPNNLSRKKWKCRGNKSMKD